MRRRRRTKPIAAQLAETAFAVPQVVLHRSVRLADPKELYAMGAEKAAAFTEAWTAMALEALRVNQQLGLSMMRSFWFPWLGIAGAGMAPVHRRAVANARRLGRAGRRRR